MHVTPKQIAFAAVAAVLLAVVLFWQGAADGMDQPQLETAAESGSAPARAEKGRDGARYEKIRGMEMIFVTTAKTDEEAKELLKALGAPFAN